jgi:hypothetical protein
MRFRVRFNKTAGQAGRGTVDHKWRVFDEDGKEYLCKAVKIQSVCWTAQDPNGVDWNIETDGTMIKEKSTSSIVIV